MQNSRNSPRQTLSKQLLIPLVSSFILIVSIITILVFIDMSESLEQSINKRLLTTAQIQKSQIETLFSYRALNIAAWVKLEVMDDIITGDIDGRINRSLQELKKSYQLRGDIFIVDIDNNLVAASNPDFLLRDITPNIWQYKGSNSELLHFKGKHINPYTGEYSVAFTHVITMSFNKKKILGTAVVTIPWNVIESIIIPPSSHGILLANDGSQLLGNMVSDNKEVQPYLISDFIDTSEVTINNQDYLMGLSHLDSVQNMPLDWLIVSLEHKKEALIPVRTLGRNIVFIAVLLTLLIILMIILLTRRAVKPIQQLTNTVLEIAESSDLSKRVSVKSNNEIGILAHSFNRMTDKLEQTMFEKDGYANRLAKLNESLEQQVSERTTAYRAANAELQVTINQLQQAQSQLVQSEKMASLGQLVAGIAHEINNPLGSINANIPIMAEYTTELFDLINSIEDKSSIAATLSDIDYDFIQEDTPQLLASMKNAATRMKDIVLSLRNFSRLDQAEVQDIRLEDAIDNTLALLAHRFKNYISIHKEYHLNKNVPCYAGLINQVFMNLLSNAEQAINGSGTITVKTWHDDNKAYVSIQDSGMGMDPTTMIKIFDPFFTTKPVGEGTGMGLSISYGIIEKHHGSITVESTPGKGTIFTLCLPMTFIPQKDVI